MLPKGLLKEHSQLLSCLIRGLDVLAITVAGWLGHWMKFHHTQMPTYYIGALILGATFTLIIFPFVRVYESARTQSLWIPIRRLIQAILIVFILLAVFAFLTKTGEFFSRNWFLNWLLVALSLLMLIRCTIFLVLRFMRTHGWNERCVIIIGAGPLTTQLIELVHQSSWTGVRIKMIWADSTASHLQGVPIQPLPATLHDDIQYMRKEIDELWITLPLQAEQSLKKILHEMRHETLLIRYIIDLSDFDAGFNQSVTHFLGYPTIQFNASPIIGMNRFFKALEDRVLAALILILISPLLCVIACGVKWTSKGPVFFKQERHGWDGRVIKVYKFRTMVEHSANEGFLKQATVDDERVTPFGRFLRRTSLDELPQFVNVLQGRMSIVGPRPHAIAHNEFYKDSIKAYMQRHIVKPGITGWAQVNGWRGETETLEKMQKRVEYDLFYIENWSLLLDLKIICLTILRGFFHNNAY